MHVEVGPVEHDAALASDVARERDDDVVGEAERAADAMQQAGVAHKEAQADAARQHTRVRDARRLAPACRVKTISSMQGFLNILSDCSKRRQNEVGGVGRRGRLLRISGSRRRRAAERAARRHDQDGGGERHAYGQRRVVDRHPRVHFRLLAASTVLWQLKMI